MVPTDANEGDLRLDVGPILHTMEMEMNVFLIFRVGIKVSGCVFLEDYCGSGMMKLATEWLRIR